ncbi:hypothetical protein DVH24_015515 [Malus domestica]|uniref:Uncharacterized protein n=1 Tax=Malus domestica TaxID=3750 RepID=A0A498HPU9_MALDO|nr:hypothetical protein DVH24_015515 [Malus domestica]
MSASLISIYGEAAPKSRTRDLPLMGEGTCQVKKYELSFYCAEHYEQGAFCSLIMYNATHEQEAYWNSEHISPCTSEIYTASEGDRYEKSVIFPLFSLISLQLGCIFDEKFDMWSNSSVAILYCSRVYFSRCFDNHQSSGRHRKDLDSLCRMFCDATWQPILRNDSRIIFLCNICFCINTLDLH